MDFVAAESAGVVAISPLHPWTRFCHSSMGMAWHGTVVRLLGCSSCGTVPVLVRRGQRSALMGAVNPSKSSPFVSQIRRARVNQERGAFAVSSSPAPVLLLPHPGSLSS